ncbi:MAG: TIGR02221 family CRISPR-associated protein, partial [Acidobacteria bacterium]|nr:TIGR02221 family CRISPR-associated protein [Acidobacteriota bacterium]MDW7983633.1 TIGR02221 family CRISPR-associated protein [Acidobacteriota bacterium]
MKVLSFLGITKYKVTTYVWQEGDEERSYETRLFPEALVHIFRPECLVVFVTSAVKNGENFSTLHERLNTMLKPVDIPEGKTKEELWEIFDRCVEAVQEGDEILLDVTHAFRSLPLLVFAVAAYLRRTKKVTIRHIVYGAYEARDDQGRSPIFDLTPL